MASVASLPSPLPQDAMQSCTLSQAEFNSWFINQTPTENGLVLPANSVTFGHNNNCDFYKWSWQMFAWLVSPLDANQSVMSSPVFYTVSPENEKKQRTLIPHVKGQALRATSSITQVGPNGKPTIIDNNGNLVESEEGQAGGSHGLMSQAGSIVYYITMVNDVFAVYLSAAKSKQMSGLQFPTTAAQRDSIVAIATANGITIPDPNALAIEIKTSWVEASTLSNPGNYFTIDAIVPTYNKTDSLWTPTGEQTIKLALLGAHVVGSTSGHPEMVWATFEHLQNAPFAAYDYLTNKNVVDTVQAESQGSWTLSAAPNGPSSNISHFKASGNTLIAENGFTISSSNTSQVFPWGSKMGVSPNAEDKSSAASNSEVISINNSVFGWLIGNDIRKNYLMIGATWTSGGVTPSGNSFSNNPTDPGPGAAIGTSLLANTTMETYKQNGTTQCFTCHSGGNLLPGTLSHVYTDLQPLPNFKILPAK
ncbi:MAG: hypothetical protein ACKVT2_03590 [Saprospiraceae bacterium]